MWIHVAELHVKNNNNNVRLNAENMSENTFYNSTQMKPFDLQSYDNNNVEDR